MEHTLLMAPIPSHAPCPLILVLPFWILTVYTTCNWQLYPYLSHDSVGSGGIPVISHPLSTSFLDSLINASSSTFLALRARVTRLRSMTCNFRSASVRAHKKLSPFCLNHLRPVVSDWPVNHSFRSDKTLSLPQRTDGMPMLSAVSSVTLYRLSLRSKTVQWVNCSVMLPPLSSCYSLLLLFYFFYFFTC